MTTVLIVDDLYAVRSVMREFLESAGYNVIEARSPAAAIQTVRTHGRVDVLVTDLVMPDATADGPDLARQLAAEQPDISVLYVSGFTNATAQKPFLAKPFGRMQLVSAVAALATRPRGNWGIISVAA